MDLEALKQLAQTVTDVAEIQTGEKKENAVLIDFKMVTFSLAGKDYGIDIMYIKEIAKAGRFTYVPNVLPFVLGVYNLRGEIIPILDLRLFFNIEVPPRQENKLENMLILSVNDQTFGLVVDKIDKVVGVQKSSIQPPHPLFGDINIKYIEGVVEANQSLYVLLDVTKIFSSADTDDVEKVRVAYNPQRFSEMPSKKPAATISETSAAAPKPAPAAPAAPAVNPNNDPKLLEGLKFVQESLKNYKQFNVTAVNETWVRRRYLEWAKTKGEGNTQLQNEADCEEFLKPFWSPYTGNWWSKDFAETIAKVLPDNTAKQIIVWNPGCGKGYETYSLACVLKKRYPGAKIRIYAQDVDLLSVSNATLLSVPEALTSDWYGPYLTKKANGEYTFRQEIKDMIMFEYHDCKNTNALPMVDLVFARDVLSLLDETAQSAVVSDFLEKMKGNGIAIIGENEAMPSTLSFGEKTVDSIVAYSKD